MGKHTPAEVKLHISSTVQPPHNRKLTTPKDNSAPQMPHRGTNTANQYR